MRGNVTHQRPAEPRPQRDPGAVADRSAAVPARLVGRVAVVTGAGGGIGAAVAARLAAEGAVVLAADVAGADADRTVAAIRSDGGTAEALQVDVTIEEQRTAAVERARALGGLHVLVNAAGIIAPQLPDEVDAATWRRVFAVNTEALFFCCQAALVPMREQGFGRIINFSSTGARVGTPALISYNASKAAVEAITRGIAAQYGREGITANTVAPGIVATTMWDTINSEVGPKVGFAPGTMMDDRVRRIPLGRAGVPADVASVVAFLASDDSRYVTGQVINVCGGLLML